MGERISPATRGTLLIATGAALWGTTAIAAKILFTTSDLPALTLGFLRLLIAAPLFLLLWQRAESRPGSGAAPGVFPWLLLMGLCQAAYQATWLWSVDLAGAGLATLVALCLAPVFVALVAVSLLREPFNRLILGGMVAALAGTTLLVTGSGTLATGEAQLAGVAIAAGAGMIYGTFTLLSRRTAGSCGPFQVAFICFASGALVMLPLVLAQNGLQPLAELETWQLGLILYVGVVPTCIGYLCFFNGMRHTPATTSSIIITLEPLFAALLAWLLLDEQLGASGLTGAILMVLGVMLASRGSRA